MPSLLLRLRSLLVRRSADRSSGGGRGSGDAATDALRLVNEAADELHRADDLARIYSIVAERARGLLGEGVVFVSALDEELDVMRVQAFAGLGDRLEEAIALIGFPVHAASFPIAEMPRDELEQFRSGRFLRLEGGLHRLLLGKVPRPVCAALESLFGVDSVYAQGFVWNGAHFGGLSVIGRAARIEQVGATLETLVRQASICVHRLRVEQDLSLHKFAVDQASLYVLWIGRDGRVLYANRLAEGLRAEGPEEGRGRRVWELLAPLSPEAWAALSERLEGEGEVAIENTATRASDGSQRVLESRFHLLQTRDGSMVVAFAEDVTERGRLEAQLRQAQKIEAIGQLAGGVAHDFNNILAVIVASADMILDELPEASRARDDALAIADAAERASKLTAQLLAFGRRGLARPVAVGLDEAVRRIEPMLRRVVGEEMSLATRLEAPAARVRIDPNQLDQVLLNLVVNARDAMPGGGPITIATRVERLAAPRALRHGEVPAGEWLALEVTDAGEGMSDEVQGRLFEPFFTTKAQGKGTGLGLATLWGIVKQAGGHVGVRSSVGGGASFTMLFPPAPIDDAPAAVAADRAAQPSPPITVLLVEDQEAPRRVIKRMLERLGHRVIEAPSGAAALASVGAGLPPIDLLLTDVIMPGMTGRQLAARVAERLGRLPVLYMSGYAREVLGSGAVDEGIELLAKPFTQDQLLAKVARVLARAREARATTRV